MRWPPLTSASDRLLQEIAYYVIVLMTATRVATAETVGGGRRAWGEASMDVNDDCEQMRRPKHDIAAGDVFVVKSDAFSGKVTSDPNKQPAECSVGFNFGDRLLSVAVVDWTCDHLHHSDRGQTAGSDWNDRSGVVGGGSQLTLTKQTTRSASYHDIEPFLSVFADCDGKQKTLLARLNCSSVKPSLTINSSTSCLWLYHFRGHRKGGYYFLLHVIAGNERIAFPAGGIAAVVIGTVVVLMVVAKVICVTTGYEQRMPNVESETDEESGSGVGSSIDMIQHRKRATSGSSAAGHGGSLGRSSVIGVSSLSVDQQVAAPFASRAQLPPSAASSCGVRSGGENFDPRELDGDNVLSYSNMPSEISSYGRRPTDMPPCGANSGGIMTSRSNGSVASVTAASAQHQHHHPTTDVAEALATAAELAASCHFDLDFLDLPTEDGYPPRLKRYPSARASSMWRHK